MAHQLFTTQQNEEDNDRYSDENYYSCFSKDNPIEQIENEEIKLVKQPLSIDIEAEIPMVAQSMQESMLS